MPHTHGINDADTSFTIDPASRAVTNKSGKVTLVQYDHDSEKFTFRIPRYVEDHDMTLCNKIEIHYTNITRNKKEQNDDVYIVKKEDIIFGSDTVFFSWTISSNATQLVGSLKFSITFICNDDENNIVYEWSTDQYTGIQILEKLTHTENLLNKYPDLIEQMKQEILNNIPSSGDGVIDNVIDFGSIPSGDETKPDDEVDPDDGNKPDDGTNPDEEDNVVEF